MPTIIDQKKKLNYIASLLTPAYQQNENPEFCEFIELYLEYLNNELYKWIIDIGAFYDLEKVDSKFVNAFFEMYASGSINTTSISLDTETKTIFNTFNKYISNLKGLKNGFDVSYRYQALAEYYVSPTKSLPISSFGVVIDEGRSKDSTFTYYYNYDATLRDDGIQLVTSDFEKLFRNIHPLGFSYEITSTDVYATMATLSMTNTLSTALTYSNQYIGSNQFVGQYNNLDSCFAGFFNASIRT